MKKQLMMFGSVLVFVVMSMFLAPAAYATNGMNLEGYGPIATGMGGASMAYDNGAAAMMNNPATLGLMPQGDRLDMAVGMLGPHVKATNGTSGQSSTSSANAFYMPAFGWVSKSGALTYGAGMFSQGGMGAEYSADSFLAYGSNEKVRSELGVGRVLFPVAYNVNKDFTIGGSLDFVWASLDLKMALSGAQFLDMTSGGSQANGTVSGSMMTTFNQFVMGGMISDGTGVKPIPVNYGRFDFSDDSAFSGKAKATGFGGKVGGVYKINDAVSVGFAYHSKTWLGDMEANGATVSFNANVDDNLLNNSWNGIPVGQPGNVGAPAGTYSAQPIPLTGKIKVKDFQWPQILGAGASYQVSDNLMVVFDYKWINWAAVMKNFKMVFTADSSQAGLAQGFADTELDATMFQKWKDQHVFMLGAGYKVSPEWVIRAGLNLANNPIPDQYLLPLFPAIEKNHVMLGAGYMISKVSSVDASFTYAPEVKATTTVMTNTGPVPVTVAHSQTNVQLVYSYRF